MIYKTPQFQIYFGGAADAISKIGDCIPAAQPLANHEKFKPICDMLKVQDLAFLNQTHSTDGMIIADKIPAFDEDGDYLITDKKSIGIGVMTADCLPIIVYDSKNHVAAIAHAGWRGTVGEVAIKTVQNMQQVFGTSLAQIGVFFGPSAKQCCYVVDELFVSNIKEFTLQVIERNRNGALCFNLPGLNELQLHRMGIPKAALNKDYNLCTMCDEQFFSYRRQGQQAGRQMSIIALR